MGLISYTPRNLVLALIGEFGESAELFQWKGDGNFVMTEDELDKVGQELADITIYLLRLAHVCSINVGDLAVKKANEEHILRRQRRKNWGCSDLNKVAA